MIELSNISTRPPKGFSKKKIQEKTKKLAKRICELQHLMMAQGKYSLLVIFQGMDASGKDGAVKKVFAEVPANGIKVHSFKKPSNEDFAHDFLWRIHKQCPEKGMIQVFNRSQYEDILIQRVHGWITEEHVHKRMAAINAFEELLEFDNNTMVLKFYLHLSKAQQVLELRERIEDPTKYWKHNDGDWEQREHWDEYQKCYHYILNESKIPWIVTPVDSRWYRDFVVAETIVNKLESLDMQYPKLESEMFK